MSNLTLIRGWVLTLLLLAPLSFLSGSGCTHARDIVSQLGMGQSADRAEAETEVEQTAGRDAFSLSPSIVVTGGGLGMTVLGGLLLLWVRRHKDQQLIRLLIGVIEKEPGSPDIKKSVRFAAMDRGLSTSVHKAVKRWTP